MSSATERSPKRLKTEADSTESSKMDTDEIPLTDVENNLKKLLLDVAEFIDENPAQTPEATQVSLPEDLEKAKLELRFTGGWVRDKLLGVASHDIDVGINKMTGYQFGLRMKDYLDQPGKYEKYGIDSKGSLVGGLHKIEVRGHLLSWNNHSWTNIGESGKVEASRDCYH